MTKPVALLLLLAVAASQVPDYVQAEVHSLSSCNLFYYGRNFSLLEVTDRSPYTDICFKNNVSEPSEDCLVLGYRSTITSSNMTQTDNPQITALLNKYTLPASSNCSVKLSFQNASSSTHMDVTFYKFGLRTFVEFMVYDAATSIAVNVHANVDNSTVGNWTLDRGVADYQTLSGCRGSDGVLLPNSTTTTDTCSIESCSPDAEFSSDSTCGPQEVCHNSNCIIPSPVCSVTGSTVIDFLGRVYTVPDRCAYTLLSNLNFGVSAAFAERRRKDVPFLDHLIISLNSSSVVMFLEQGGRVRVGSQTLILNATAQTLHGVELSRDLTGVTAKIPSFNTTVFFDGYTAHVAGPVEADMGLCGSPTIRRNFTTSDTLNLNHSADGCQTLYNDTVDSTINCNRTTEHCSLIREAPFAACHKIIDPEPYITACTDTLCSYPMVDGLKCQFFEAYAKAYGLKANATLDDWRSNASCPAGPQAFCQDHSCSAHEFCSEKHGEFHCLCRALFASKYEATNALGEPTVCMRNSATVTLAGCLLHNKGINYSRLHLQDKNCTGDMDSQSHMVTFSFDSSNMCGTEVEENGTQIIYKNTIMLSNASTSDIITRHDQVALDFSCYYTQPDIRTVAFTIKDGSVVQQIVSGVWNYTLMMNAYSDAGRMNLVNSSTEIRLDQKIWIELKTEGLDDNLVALVTDSCWATSAAPSNSTPKYDLIMNKCPNPADGTVKTEGNGVGTANYFSFNMFEFSGKSNEIYLHCSLELCVLGGRSCPPSCGTSRRRRSSRSTHHPEAVITMVWKQ